MSETASGKQNFYFSFGLKYSDEPHPHYAKAHPDGWVRIISSSYKRARQKGFDLFGPYFAFVYDEENFPKEMFKSGEIEAIEID